MSKTAQAIKSGVVMGGTAILSAVNGLTPHMAGAIDIMVVQQPDGSLKCSPFYVRFGKYTPMRSKDKKVQIFVNGEEACFSMHLGAYGQAYFAAETMEIVSDADDADELLNGMMSPSSGYSSDEDDSTPYANAAMLSAVQQEVARLQAAKAAADAAAEAANGGHLALEAAAAGDGSQPSAAAGASSEQQQPPSRSGSSGPGGGEAVLAASSNGGEGDATLSGSETDGEASSSSSSFSELPSPSEVAQALQQGLDGSAAAANGNHHQQPQQFELPPGLQPIATASSNGKAAAGGSGGGGGSSGGSSGKRRSSRKHAGKRVLQVSGDGAAGDPARSRLQDMLLDNRYSLKVQSDESFVAGAGAAGDTCQNRQQQHHQQQQPQQRRRGRSPLHQQQRQPAGDVGVQQQEQQQQQPVRHVGFQLPPTPPQHPSKASTAATRAATAAGAVAANGVHKVHAADLPVLLDSAASYSMDEISECTGTGGGAGPSSSRGPPASSEGGASITSITGPWEQQQQQVEVEEGAEGDSAPQPAAAGEAGEAAATERQAAAAAAVRQQVVDDDDEDSGLGTSSSSISGGMQPQPTLADGLLDAPAASSAIAVGPGVSGAALKQQQRHATSVQQQQQQQQEQEEQVISPGRASLLSSSLKAQQQLEASTQQEQQQQQLDVAPPAEQQQTTAAAGAADAADADSGAVVDATAILEDAAALMPSGWGMHPDSSTAQQQSQQAGGSNSSSSSSNAVVVQDTAAAAAAVDGSSAEATPRSEPVSMPSPGAPTFATSPPADSGYLGDSEAGALLGTSYEGVTPRRAAAAAAAMAAAAEGVSGPGAGPLALGLAGFQLSLCGDLLRPGIAAAEAQQVFETRRVSGQVWSERGVGLLTNPDLVVKIGGSLYSWQVAAPMVVGMLAFGGRWDSLLGLDPTGIYPIRVAEDHAAVLAAKKSSASSSWRLWPFTGWREPSGSSKQQLQGSSPSQSAGGPLPPAAAAGSASTSAAALQPSGGSFTNLRALLGPGSKSAPGRADGRAEQHGGSGAGGEGGSMGGGGGEGEGDNEGDAAVGEGAGAAGRATSFAGSPPRPSRRKHIILIRKTLTPTSEQLSLLPLRPGANTITFRAGGAADLTAYIYLLRWNTRLVVSDVDGTITRSDLLGHVLPTLGVDWSHPGITQLFHNIARNGYQIMFLSSRAIAQANITREYLHTLVQNDYKMPSGPVIISPHGLLPSLYREIVVRRPHEFKIACLQDIRALFPDEWNPFYAAFGNRDTDELAYREVGVPLSRTFTINPKGQIQKASTAVQSSTWSSLSAINDLVDEMFPGLLLHNSSSLASICSSNAAARGLQSVYTSFADTLEFAAAIGAIEHEQVAAAVLAEQQRRRSSTSVDGGSGGGGFGDAAAVAAAAAKAAAAKAGGGAGDEGQQQQQQATGSSPKVSAAVAAAAATVLARDSSVLSASHTAALLLAENVGPAREEYNDLHFWRPSLLVDIDSELAELSVLSTSSAKQPPPQPQQQPAKP